MWASYASLWAVSRCPAPYIGGLAQVQGSPRWSVGVGGGGGVVRRSRGSGGVVRRSRRSGGVRGGANEVKQEVEM